MGMLLRRAETNIWQRQKALPFSRQPGVRKPLSDGSDSVRLVAVQMNLSRFDGTTPWRFEKKIAKLMKQVKPHIAKDKPTIVAFPEFAGIPLVFMGSPLATLLPIKELSILSLLLGNLPSTIINLIRYRKGIANALLRSLDEDIRAVYEKVFSDVARKYGVYLVAGSAPITVNGKGPYNTSYFFDPYGSRLSIQRKVNLTSDEPGLGLVQSELKDIQAVKFTVGKKQATVGVEICLDAFNPYIETDMRKPAQEGDVRGKMRELEANILIQISANPGKWFGTLPNGTPQDVDWREGLDDQIQENPTAKYGLNPMAVGTLFKGITFEGVSTIIADKALTKDDSGIVAKADTHTGETIVSADVKL